WADTISYSENSIRVEQGDLLFLYTDGLAEIKNKEKTMFGQDRINEALSSMDGNDHHLMLNSMLENVYGYANINNESMQADDITMSFVELK
ncbi:MAG: serine/threonine-protein phosphatase, partial [Oscillospiraceae bacterium]|nr:serine/threonine-protein phosphatase [Oscillospiraceae bacterium]